MSMVITIHSFRGGTGKSSIAANLAVQFARRGKRVGVIDTGLHSPGIHTLFGMDRDQIDVALNHFLWGDCAIEDAAYDVGLQIEQGEVLLMGGGIYLVPSSIRAGEIARVVREGYDVGILNDGFQALIERLSLDYLIIDTHPGLDEGTVFALALADLLLVALRPDRQDLQGMRVTLDVARSLGVPGVLLVVNFALSSDDFDDLRRQMETRYKCPVAAVLPLSEDVARLASADIFSLRHPYHPFSQGIAEIVAAIEAVG